MDSLLNLGHHDNRSLLVSGSEDAGERQIILSCEQRTQGQTEETTQLDESLQSQRHTLELSTNISIEKLRADVSSMVVDQSKHDVSFEKETKDYHQPDDSDVEHAMISSQNSTYSAPSAIKRTSKGDEVCDEPVHMSDIDFDETVDIGDNIHCLLGEPAKQELFAEREQNTADNGNATNTKTPAQTHSTDHTIQDHDYPDYPEDELSSSSSCEESYLLLGGKVQRPQSTGSPEKESSNVQCTCEETDSELRTAKSADSDSKDRSTEDIEGASESHVDQQTKINQDTELDIVRGEALNAGNNTAAEDGREMWSQFPDSEDLSAFLLQADAQLQQAQNDLEDCRSDDKQLASVSCVQRVSDTDFNSNQLSKPVEVHKCSHFQTDNHTPSSLPLSDNLSINSAIESATVEKCSISKVSDCQTSAPIAQVVKSGSAHFEEEDFPESEDLDAFLQNLSYPWDKQQGSESETHAQFCENQRQESSSPNVHVAVDIDHPLEDLQDIPAVETVHVLDNEDIVSGDIHSERSQTDSVSDVESPSPTKKDSPSSATSLSITTDPMISPLRRTSLSGDAQLSSPGLHRSPTKFSLKEYVEKSLETTTPSALDSHSAAKRPGKLKLYDSDILEGSADLFGDDDDNDDVLTISNMCSGSWESSYETGGSDSVFTEEDQGPDIYRGAQTLTEIRRVTHVSASVSSLRAVQQHQDIDPENTNQRRTSVWFAPRLSTIENITNIDIKMMSTPSPEPVKLVKRRRSCLKKASNFRCKINLAPSRTVDVESQDMFCSPVVCDSPQFRTLAVEKGAPYQSTPVKADRHSDVRAGRHCDVSPRKCNDDDYDSYDKDIDKDLSSCSEDAMIVPPSCPNTLKPSAATLISPAVTKLRNQRVTLSQGDSLDLFDESGQEDKENSGNPAQDSDYSRNPAQDSDLEIIPSSAQVVTRHRPFLSKSLGWVRQLKTKVTMKEKVDEVNISQDMFADSVLSTDSLLVTSMECGNFFT